MHIEIISINSLVFKKMKAADIIALLDTGEITVTFHGKAVLRIQKGGKAGILNTISVTDLIRFSKGDTARKLGRHKCLNVTFGKAETVVAHVIRW